MKDFIARVGRVCANHCEKIVFVAVAVVCAWLLFTRVLFSPNAVQIGGRTLPPQRVDRYIAQQAEELQAKLHRQDQQGSGIGYASWLDGRIEPNDPVVAGIIDRPLPQGFKGLFEDPLGAVDAGTGPQMPQVASTQPPQEPASALPEVPKPAQVEMGSQSPPQAQVENTPQPQVAQADVTPQSTPQMQVQTAPQSPPQAQAEVAAQLPAPATRPEGARYRLPQVPELTEVLAGHVRAAAYAPLGEVTPQNAYGRGQVEVNDVDLVTVEARFDVGELYSRFHRSFASAADQGQAVDPCLAEPVFAAVHLQRQESAADGNWSDWQDVPRSRVEAHREQFQIFERLQDLPPGGMSLQLAQFRSREIVMALLQPEMYRIASADEDWFPPSYHDTYWSLQRKVEMKEMREEREQQRESVKSTRSDDTNPDRLYRGTQRTPRTGITQRTRGATPNRQNPVRLPGTPPIRRDRTRTRATTESADAIYEDVDATGQTDRRRLPVVDDVYDDFAEELMRADTDLSEWEDGLLIWVVDETGEPGKTYRYRLRVGVFNPVAGTDALDEQDVDKKDLAVLWSEFSEPTEAVWIPGRLYLFARSVQAQAKTVTMEVSRYRLGYWRTESFEVRPGDAIGRKRELTEQAERSRPQRDPSLPTIPDDTDRPVIVDFSTGTRLVDLAEVPSSAQNQQPYYEALCSGDGANVEHLPIGASQWPSDVRNAHQYVQSEMRRTPKPFRPFRRSGPRARQPRDSMYPASPYPN